MKQVQHCSIVGLSSKVLSEYLVNRSLYQESVIHRHQTNTFLEGKAESVRVSTEVARLTNWKILLEGKFRGVYYIYT